MNPYSFDWQEVAFSSKKPINNLKATFLAAPRDISVKRFTELVKTYLPSGNIVLGVSKEEYIAGFEGQPQFKTLNLQSVQPVIDKVNKSVSPNKIYTLGYQQREAVYLYEKLKFRNVVLVNGSWKQAFHTTDIFYALVRNAATYSLVSAFVDEHEARQYSTKADKALNKLFSIPKIGIKLTDTEMLETAKQAAVYSYDYSYQTGTALGKKSGKKYALMTTSFNKVVPYQTFAMLNGAARETMFSPPNDLNHYDTVHAEIELLLTAQKHSLDLKGTTLFINLLPCPTCARMLCDSDIEEVVYQTDHSSGYAVYMLEQSGKTVRRVVADR